MRKYIIDSRIVPILLLVLGLAACGKDKESTIPDLSSPKPVLVRDGGSSTSKDVVAEAEVRASSGPVQLVLRLYKTKIKTEEALWYQIQLENVGKEKLFLWDQIFLDPWQIIENTDSKTGIYLEVIGPDAKPLTRKLLGGALPVAETTEESRNIVRWKKQNLSDAEISRRLSHSPEPDDSNSRPGTDSISPWLEPGASNMTPPWGYFDENGAVVKPIGKFAQLWLFNLKEPGKYTIRAVYDKQPSRASRNRNIKYGREPDPEYVQFKTPYIDVEVLP